MTSTYILILTFVLCFGFNILRKFALAKYLSSFSLVKYFQNVTSGTETLPQLATSFCRSVGFVVNIWLVIWWLSYYFMADRVTRVIYIRSAYICLHICTIPRYYIKAVKFKQWCYRVIDSFRSFHNGVRLKTINCLLKSRLEKQMTLVFFCCCCFVVKNCLINENNNLCIEFKNGWQWTYSWLASKLIFFLLSHFQ